MKRQRSTQPDESFDVAALYLDRGHNVGARRAAQEASNDEPMVIQIRTTEWVTVELFSRISGLTQPAVRCMIHEGKWLEGRHYQRRAGRVYVSIKAFEKWVATGSA